MITAVKFVKGAEVKEEVEMKDGGDVAALLRVIDQKNDVIRVCHKALEEYEISIDNQKSLANHYREMVDRGSLERYTDLENEYNELKRKIYDLKMTNMNLESRAEYAEKHMRRWLYKVVDFLTDGWVMCMMLIVFSVFIGIIIGLGLA